MHDKGSLHSEVLSIMTTQDQNTGMAIAQPQPGRSTGIKKSHQGPRQSYRQLVPIRRLPSGPRMERQEP